MCKLYIYALSLLFICVSFRSYSLDKDEQYLNNIDFYLHTVDAGNMVYTNFGHTTIRIVNKNDGRDLVYNWGVFDFGSSPIQFALNFFKGLLNYKLAVYTYEKSLALYKWDGRTVWEDKINLTLLQKKKLLEKINWNLKPENRYYIYQYFFKNCSTLPRDFFNELFDDKIFQKYSKEPTHQTYRDMIRSHFEFNPEISFSLDILMNSRVDRQMSMWDKMFLPKTLREYMRSFPSKVEESGEMLPFLTYKKTLVEFTPPIVPIWNIYSILLYLFFLPLAAISLRVYLKRKNELNYSSKAFLRIFGFFCIVMGLIFGGFGLLMPISWMVSSHVDLHHNINQWLIWPCFIGLFPIGIYWLVWGKPLQILEINLKRIRIFFFSYGTVLFIYSLAGIFNLGKQNITNLIYYIVPVIFVTILLWNQIGVEAKKN